MPEGDGSSIFAQCFEPQQLFHRLQVQFVSTEDRDARCICDPRAEGAQQLQALKFAPLGTAAAKAPPGPGPSDQLAAIEVFPNPAGVLITAGGLLEGQKLEPEDVGDRSGRGTGDTILLMRKGTCLPPRNEPVPAASFERGEWGSIKDIPGPLFDPFGGHTV
jgi:hypothetical protein